MRASAASARREQERFERFSLAIFEISRYWHKLAAEEMAGGGLSEEARACFYEALGSITARLREISRDGLPQDSI